MDREATAYTMYLQRRPVEEVMKTLGIKRAQAYRLIATAKKKAAEAVRELEGKEGVAHQFAVLQFAQQEALAAWDRSKGTKERKSKSAEKADNPEKGITTKTKAGTVEEKLIGDVRYLQVATEAGKQIRELIGLDSIEVKRILITDITAQTKITPEELRAMDEETLMERIKATIAGA